MAQERFGLIKFKGNDMTIVGNDLQMGDVAPEFNVQGLDWVATSGLKSTQGKVRVIAAVPSLDTDTCDREGRRFNLEAAALGSEIAILVVSMDLPFAQKRWCGAVGVDKLIVLSDHLLADFGEKYGCLMKEVRLLRRAIFVVDRNNKVCYAEYMPALGVEPNYDEVLRAAMAALG